MPFKTFWYIKNQVVFTEIVGDFTVEEMICLNEEYADIYFTGYNKRIHLIADLRGMSNYPKNLVRIRDITRQTALQSELGWIILIGTENALLKFLSETVLQLLHIKCEIVQTLDDAEETLKRIKVVNST